MFKYLRPIFSNAPFFVHIFLTRRCNLKCKFCEVWTKSNLNEELSLAKIKDMVKILKKLGVPVVTLTGGEPLLRKDIYEIVQIFREAGFKVRLQTNGTILNQALKEIVKQDVDIQISFHTILRKNQTEISGFDSWDKIKNTIEYCAKNRSKKSMIYINVVISSFNIEEVPEIIKYVNTTGLSVAMNPANLSYGNSYEFRASSKNFPVDLYQIEKVFGEIISMKKSGRYKITYPLKMLTDSRDYLLGKKVNWKCYAGIKHLDIMPNGDVCVCQDLKPFANIFEDNFVRSYQSKEYRKQMRRITSSCPGCYYPCYVGVSYLMTRPHIFLRELKLYKWN